ncbi:U4/U6-U5 snRNP complex subunit lsm6 [Maublancomyces gigas]|uniref:U6 snRNA-associated Sm-like protein LSm6 n=1 Tax=Discina gigas TaxID=1032678 RepID=A0ABR3GCI7_9PEZI
MTENGPADAPTGSTSDPSGFLSEIIGSPITVKLNSGVEYRGELSSVDGYMNIALEKTVEYVNGEVRNKYGDVFIRGNNGTVPPPLFLFCPLSAG